MRKHLLVTYAWSINNIGDMGIQAGLMTLLREKCPGLPVKLMSYLPENDECYRHYRDVLPEYNPDGQVIPMPFFDLIGADPVPGAASAALENAAVRGKHGTRSVPAGRISNWNSSGPERFPVSRRKNWRMIC